ncbi:cyclic nucleotide-gated ion channel 1-like [Juglans microcarpa x Juglans regia]|uniref:cyclic nucleotide-gated ion channel 1-like n=1 Tax=Juglans microcarpa x Juglans regia TaxID=2249226 RepID=UPI001B7DC90E|nr:cyclic nucleotide-gated ion channel 1-like [Juglans microcarpa x Juglans regia]
MYPSTFSCHKRSPSLGNYTFLNDYCPLDKARKSKFDLGIFLDAIEYGTVESKDFPKKMLHCFWWGLKNLSSFGQNLQTTNYFWENCFAVFISISGLLLFLYFIGNVQTYIQLTTARTEEVIQKMKIKERDIELWISRNNFGDDIKPHIMPNIQRVLEQNIDVDPQNPLPHLPIEIRKDIKRHLCLPMLKKVPMLQTSEKHMLQSICDSLKPVYYNERTYIVREGEPLDTMLFVTQGIIWNFTTSRRVDGTFLSGECIERGNFYGEELLAWGFRGSPEPNLSDLPVSTKTVKTHTKVEGFVLTANDLNTLISRRPIEAAFALQAAWRRFNGKKKGESMSTNFARRRPKRCHSHSSRRFKTI